MLEATSRSLLLVGRYKQAAESLQHIKKMRNSPNSKHHLNLGQCYKSAGVKAQAFDELERSINLNPNDSNLFEMAEFMLQDDKRDEAIRYLRKGSNHFVVFIDLRIGPVRELRNLFKDKASKYIQIPQHSI